MSPSAIPGLSSQSVMMLRTTLAIEPEWKSTCGPIVTTEPSPR